MTAPPPGPETVGRRWSRGPRGHQSRHSRLVRQTRDPRGRSRRLP